MKKKSRGKGKKKAPVMGSLWTALLKSPLYQILLVALVLRLVLALVYPTTGDACSHELIIRMFQWNWGPVSHFGLGPQWAPYFYHLVVSVVSAPFHLVDAFSFGTVVVNLTLGIASVWAIHGIVLKLTKKEHLALVAAAALALFPLHIFYSAVLYTDVPIFACTLLFLYFLLHDRIYPAAIFGACAMLAKMNGIIVLPLIAVVFLFRKDRWKSTWWKKLVLISIITLVLGSFFFVRNTIEYGGPFSLGSAEQFGEAGPRLDNILNTEVWKIQFFTLFGVPQGNFSQAMSHLPVSPFLQALIGNLWILLGLSFFVPIVVGLHRAGRKHIFMVCVGAVYLFFHVAGMSFLGAEDTQARYSMGILLPMIFFFSIGALALYEKYKTHIRTHQKLLCIALLVIVLGAFYLPFHVQAHIANGHFGAREPVYEVIRNLPADARIYSSDRCAETHTARLLPFLQFEKRERFLGPQEDDVYILQDKHIAILPDEDINRAITAEYEVFVEAGDIELLRKRKTE